MQTSFITSIYECLVNNNYLALPVLSYPTLQGGVRVYLLPVDGGHQQLYTGGATPAPPCWLPPTSPAHRAAVMQLWLTRANCDSCMQTTAPHWGSFIIIQCTCCVLWQPYTIQQLYTCIFKHRVVAALCDITDVFMRYSSIVLWQPYTI